MAQQQEADDLDEGHYVWFGTPINDETAAKSSAFRKEVLDPAKTRAAPITEQEPTDEQVSARAAQRTSPRPTRKRGTLRTYCPVCCAPVFPCRVGSDSTGPSQAASAQGTSTRSAARCARIAARTDSRMRAQSLTAREPQRSRISQPRFLLVHKRPRSFEIGRRAASAQQGRCSEHRWIATVCAGGVGALHLPFFSV